MLDKTFISIVTVPERADICEKTVADLERKWDICPTKVFMQRKSKRGKLSLVYQQQLVLKFYLQTDIDYLLFLEDDLIFSDRIPPAEIWKHDLLSLYLPNKRFYPARIFRDFKIFCIFEIINRKAYFGSQAILLSREAAKRLLKRWHIFFGKSYSTYPYLDRMLSEFDEFPFMSVSPNFIQHRSPKPVWSSYGKPHKSISYV